MKLRRDAKVDLLRSVSLFAGCSKKELGLIATLADELQQPAGTTLTVEGTRGREFFVLVDGEVAVLRGGRKVRTLEDGAFFGEIALVTDSPRTATVMATGPVRLLVITGHSFRRLVQDTPSMRAKVLAALAERAPAGPSL
jgi:CRP/FNR family cyclic AMP-dependent transcriptional regulator